MDLGRQRGFLLDGEDPPKKVGCRKKSYFLEFMNVGVSRNLGGVVSLSLMVPQAPKTTGTVVILSPHIHSTSISESLYLLSFSLILTDVLELRGVVVSMRRQCFVFLFFSTLSGLLAAMVPSV